MIVPSSYTLFLSLSCLLIILASGGAIPKSSDTIDSHAILPKRQDDPALQTVTTNITSDGEPVFLTVNVADSIAHLQAALDTEGESFDGDIGAAATRLVLHNGCDDIEKRLIYDGWRQSWKIMNNLLDEMELNDINWNEAAAVEYLGPPVYTRPAADRFKDLYGRWATIQPGYISTPFDWRLHVRCDDPKLKCKDPCDPDPRKRGPYAYTTNRDSDSGLARINFCPLYFYTPNLKQAVDFGNDPNMGVDWQYDVGNYLMNKAHVWAHELMHIDWAVNAGRYGSQRHVSDINMEVNLRGGGTATIAAYEPQGVKALARFSPDTADWTIRNADSLSLYAFVRYLQKQLGGNYPHLPLAPLPPISVTDPPDRSSLPYSKADLRGWDLFSDGTVGVPPLQNLWSNVDINAECRAFHSEDEGVIPEAEVWDEDVGDDTNNEVILNSFASANDLGEDYTKQLEQWWNELYKVECNVPSGCINVGAPSGCAIQCT